MFRDSGSFNQDLTTWTLDSAANFRDMFFGSSRFNGEISGFVLSRVTVATRMFRDSGISQNLCFLARGRNSVGFTVGGMFRDADGCGTQADPDPTAPYLVHSAFLV